MAHDPGLWLEDVLAGLAAQTYPDLSVLIIDAGSAEDLTARIAETLPDAFVRRLGHNPGFGAATNAATALVAGASFYLLCHDDVALEPDALRSMVEEAFRSNAGVVGPKLVNWNDPRRLLQVGLNADKAGVVVPVAERGELDQEQYDGVRDVFAVPGAATLIRSDLFDELGGFDETIDYLGDDVDLCWRCHVAGARVLIAPQARVRHLEALGVRRPQDDRRRLAARHRLRSVLGSYSSIHLLRVLPQALLFMLIESTYALLTGRVDHAREVAGAWSWNARRLGSLHRRRKRLRRLRSVSDREIRKLQIGGSARISRFLRGQIGRGDRRVGDVVTRSGRELVGSLRKGSNRQIVLLTGALLVLLLVSSRDLISGRLPAVGELARFPSSPGPLFREWVNGWRTAGLGSTSPAPTGFGLLGLLGVLSFGAMGVLRKILVIGMLPIGALGAWRLARPIGSRRSSAVAFAVYIAIPVPYNALARGSWGGLLLYAASPWLFLGLARASRMAPYGRRGIGPRPAERVTFNRTLIRQILVLGLILALVGSVVPFVVAVVMLMALGLAVGSLVCLRLGGAPRMLAAGVGACAVALVLHLPWSLDFLRTSSDWTAFAGTRAAAGGPLSLGRVMRFQSGPFGAPPLGWAFLLAAAVPLVIGRSWRLEWAVRAWFVALAGWGVVWAGQEGWLPLGLPSPEILLAPVAVALSLAAALGLAAFETDLRAYRFGWRQAIAVAGAVGVVVGALPLASGLVDGRWKLPGHDFSVAYDQLFGSRDDRPYRVLWVGDPEVLPLAGWRLDSRLAYATTDHGAPDVTDLWAGSADRSTRLLADALRIAQDGGTARLGRLLAPMAIRYLMVPDRIAPPPFDRDVRPPTPKLIAALSEQLDLEQVPVSNGLTVYRNRAWVASRAVLPETDAPRRTFTDAIADDLSAGKPALTSESGPTSAHGVIPAPGSLLVASASSPRWQVKFDGKSAPRSVLFGWANGFRVTPSSHGSLSYRTPIERTLALIGQVALWLVVLIALVRYRRRDRRGAKAVRDVDATQRKS